MEECLSLHCCHQARRSASSRRLTFVSALRSNPRYPRRRSGILHSRKSGFKPLLGSTVGGSHSPHLVVKLRDSAIVVECPCPLQNVPVDLAEVVDSGELLDAVLGSLCLVELRFVRRYRSGASVANKHPETNCETRQRISSHLGRPWCRRSWESWRLRSQLNSLAWLTLRI